MLNPGIRTVLERWRMDFWVSSKRVFILCDMYLAQCKFWSLILFAIFINIPSCKNKYVYLEFN